MSEKLPWEWVEERLRTTHNYWLATASAARGPHVRPVWCLWRDGGLLFTASPSSRKMRDLAGDPRATVHLELVREVVVLAGTVAETDPSPEAVDAYVAKYGRRPPAEQRWYVLHPTRCDAAVEDTYPESATRFAL